MSNSYDKAEGIRWAGLAREALVTADRCSHREPGYSKQAQWLWTAQVNATLGLAAEVRALRHSLTGDEQYATDDGALGDLGVELGWVRRAVEARGDR